MEMDPSYEEVKRMINEVAYDLALTGSGGIGCCSLKDLRSELGKTHGWFRRCAGLGLERNCEIALDSDKFVVCNGMVHII